MIGKIKIFSIGNMNLDKSEDLDKGIEFLKGVKLKLKGGKKH